MTQTARFTDPAAFRAFLTAGHAVFTVVSLATRVRHTFRVEEAPPKPGTLGRAYFAAHLTGPDNERDYSPLGVILPGAQPRLVAAKAHPERAQLPSFLALQWVISQANQPDCGKLFSQAEVWHEGKCGKCGRTLTTPESIASGIGPVCAGKE